MIYVENKNFVIPGQVLADDDYYSGRGTFKEDGKVCSSLMGRVSLRNKKIRVIPFKSKYVPKKGDVVIGKIKDVRFSMWDVDINSPYSGILPASEVFNKDKKELNKVFDVGDVLFLRVVEVDEIKKAKLGLKGRGMGKFRGGIMVDIAPTKVPRLIGKKGSMINMIKDKTNCKIVVGQNGIVWVKGEEDMEQLTKNIIHTIEAEAHTSGLTNKIKNKLYLTIDGELPPEETPEAEEEFVLEKPKLQNFKDELEQEKNEVRKRGERPLNGLKQLVDTAHILHRPLDGPGYLVDLGVDRLRRRPGLGGQLLDVLGHDRKSPAVLPRPSCLDGGVEGQKMRLLGDALDIVGDLSDLEEQFQGLDGRAQRVGDGLAHAL